MAKLNTFLVLTLFVTSLNAQTKTQRSLIIVFDATGSMSDDLAQVRPATNDIIKTYSDHPDKPIKNYILSVFHDPSE